MGKNCVLTGKELIKTDPPPRDYTSCFERSAIGAGKLTSSALCMIDGLCPLLGEKCIS